MASAVGMIDLNTFKNTRFEGHLYLDHHFLPTVWNVVRGGFDSVDNLPLDEQDFALSVAVSNMIGNGCKSAMRLESELNIELLRQRTSPQSVSRLTGMFVFNDLESLSQIWDANDWGDHCKQEYLTDVDVVAKRLSRHDANWVAHMIAHDGSLMADWEQAAASYWKGGALCRSYSNLGVHRVWGVCHFDNGCKTGRIERDSGSLASVP